MIERLLKWMDRSTCNLMAADTIVKELEAAGFTRLDPTAVWKLEPCGKYFMTRNGTAVFALVAGTEAPCESGFNIVASHSDSPSLKIKPNAEIYCEGGLVKLNVEKYGGGILYTWFDRPLSVSGRVTLRTDNPLEPEIRLVDFKKAICTIPHLAIHFNRAVNEGNAISVQRDMLPVAGVFSREEIESMKASGGLVKTLLADKLDILPGDILDYELNLYPLEKAARCGVHDEFFQSGRIDDLSMAFASLQALLDTCDAPSRHTRVVAIFDNEETGSGTKQGAHSPVLANMLERAAASLCGEGHGNQRECFHRAVSRSFLISADDAHAWHPNYDGKYDPTNHPVMGGGPVVKINANCKYMTDADGAAVFRHLCEKAGVPCQTFVNHSDVAGGSTLGNILTGQLDLRGVDVGNPIWAMHSARETASCADHLFMTDALTTFFRL